MRHQIRKGFTPDDLKEIALGNIGVAQRVFAEFVRQAGECAVMARWTRPRSYAERTVRVTSSADLISTLDGVAKGRCTNLSFWVRRPCTARPRLRRRV